MKTNFRLFLFIAGIIFLASCGHPNSHDKELEFYKTVATEMKNSSKIVNDLMHVTSEAYKTAQQNQKKKLESDRIDTLIKSYQISTLALSKSIDKLSAVIEIDHSINLKERSLELLKNTKSLVDSSWPVIIKILSTGLGKPTDEEKELSDKFQLIIGELQIASGNFEKLALDYRDKHKITSDELMKYGL